MGKQCSNRDESPLQEQDSATTLRRTWTLEDSHVCVLARENRWLEKAVKESIHIQLEKPSLVRGGGLRHVLSAVSNAVHPNVHTDTW